MPKATNCQRNLGSFTRVPNWGKIDKLITPSSPPPSEDSKFFMLLVSGLAQAYPCCHANWAATTKGLEKLSTMYIYTHQIDNELRLHFKGHAMQDWTKEHTSIRVNQKEEWNIKIADEITNR